MNDIWEMMIDEIAELYDRYGKHTPTTHPVWLVQNYNSAGYICSNPNKNNLNYFDSVDLYKHCIYMIYVSDTIK